MTVTADCNSHETLESLVRSGLGANAVIESVEQVRQPVVQRFEVEVRWAPCAYVLPSVGEIQRFLLRTYAGADDIRVREVTE
jgi:hypothetical protein